MKIILEEYENQFITLDLDSDCECYHLKIKQFTNEAEFKLSLEDFKGIIKYLKEMEV